MNWVFSKDPGLAVLLEGPLEGEVARPWRSFLSGSSHAYPLRSAGTAGSVKIQSQTQWSFTGLSLSFLKSFVNLVL